MKGEKNKKTGEEEEGAKRRLENEKTSPFVGGQVTPASLNSDSNHFNRHQRRLKQQSEF